MHSVPIVIYLLHGSHPTGSNEDGVGRTTD